MHGHLQSTWLSSINLVVFSQQGRLQSILSFYMDESLHSTLYSLINKVVLVKSVKDIRGYLLPTWPSSVNLVVFSQLGRLQSMWLSSVKKDDIDMDIFISRKKRMGMVVFSQERKWLAWSSSVKMVVFSIIILYGQKSSFSTIHQSR